MLQHWTVSFVIGAVFLIALVASSDDPNALNRRRRQAPNINVHKIPKTSFSCTDKKVGDYYADPETTCQVYHVCIPGMNNKMSLISFVCPNGTIFSQATRVCTPYDRVDCSLTLQFYGTTHGNFNSRRTNNDEDTDYDNYVPPAPRAPAPRQPAPAPRQPAPAPRQPAPPARAQPQASRNTIPPTQPEEPARTPSRFRTGSSQFRGPQARPAQTPAPARQPASQAQPARQATPAARPVVPGFRPPVAGRPVQAVTPAPAAPAPRPTPRAAVSTSTSNYNYEYEYEYDYEDELPAAEQANTRSKREAVLSSYTDDYEAQGLDMEREPQETSFTCRDKVAGGVYADIETDCEMFHICVPLGKHKMLDYKVYCATGTAFDQETGSCKEKTEFKCENAQLFYQFDKLNQPISEKKPVYKKSSYSKSKKASATYKE